MFIGFCRRKLNNGKFDQIKSEFACGLRDDVITTRTKGYNLINTAKL